MITMRALVTAESVEVSYSVKITAASALGRQIAQHRDKSRHKSFRFSIEKSQIFLILAIYGIFSPNATYT
jgi:hypothetical protein